MNLINFILIMFWFMICIFLICRLFESKNKMKQTIKEHGEGIKALWIEIEHLKCAICGSYLEDTLDNEIQDVISQAAWADGHTDMSGNPRSEPYYTIRQENFENLEIAIRELVNKYRRKK